MSKVSGDSSSPREALLVRMTFVIRKGLVKMTGVMRHNSSEWQAFMWRDLSEWQAFYEPYE